MAAQAVFRSLLPAVSVGDEDDFSADVSGGEPPVRLRGAFDREDRVDRKHELSPGDQVGRFPMERLVGLARLIALLDLFVGIRLPAVGTGRQGLLAVRGSPL